jgi:hypothetical protein
LTACHFVSGIDVKGACHLTRSVDINAGNEVAGSQNVDDTLDNDALRKIPRARARETTP